MNEKIKIYTFHTFLCVEQVRCACITKEDFRSCMNEKKFQEVLEDVAYQRASYREQRAQQAEDKV